MLLSISQELRDMQCGCGQSHNSEVAFFCLPHGLAFVQHFVFLFELQVHCAHLWIPLLIISTPEGTFHRTVSISFYTSCVFRRRRKVSPSFKEASSLFYIPLTGIQAFIKHSFLTCAFLKDHTSLHFECVVFIFSLTWKGSNRTCFSIF